MVQAIGGSVRATSGQIAKAAPDIATSLKLMAEHSAAASDQTEMLAEEGTKTVARLSGLVDNVDGMVSDLRKDIYTANTLISDLDAGIKPLLESGDDSVKSLKVTLDEFTKLEVALNEQLSVGSPEVLATLTAMRKLAEDEKWDQTLDHIEAATNSGAEILSTVDQSTRFLRKKMGQLRFVLTRIASMIKVSFIPF
jgi:type I site-specific restriction endonuclease